MPIRDDHFEEWVKGSGVGEAIANLNVESLDDSQEIDKRLNRNNKRRTKHTDWGTGGWYVSGVDPLTGEKHGIGGQFKPDRPRLNANQKPIKYESASDYEAVPLFLDTGDRNYWPNILAGTEAIVITEGAKKAGAGLTAGVPTISLPGVTNGQKQGRLKEHLRQFCKLGRRVYLCFDSDLLVKFQVRKALDSLGRLIAECGSIVSIVSLPAETKGLDDFIVAKSGEAFKALLKNVQTFEEWRNDLIEIERQNAEEEKCFTQLAFEALYTDEPWVSINDVMHRWTGTHYEPSSDAIERRRVWNFCNKYGTVTDDGAKVKISYKYANPAIINRVLEWAKQGTSIDPDTVNPTGLNLSNGVLNITWQGNQPSWQLIKHDPKIVYTYISKVQYSGFQKRKA
jgi:putative DNA primase/helicase